MLEYPSTFLMNFGREMYSLRLEDFGNLKLAQRISVIRKVPTQCIPEIFSDSLCVVLGRIRQLSGTNLHVE